MKKTQNLTVNINNKSIIRGKLIIKDFFFVISITVNLIMLTEIGIKIVKEKEVVDIEEAFLYRVLC